MIINTRRSVTLRPFILYFLLFFYPLFGSGQEINSAYVKSLYAKFPTQKTDLCSSCLLWINPYFRSIADTVTHTPKITFYIYTRTHRIEQETLDLPRTGIYSAWHAAAGQPDETDTYRYANKIIGKPNSSEMIAKGHCQAWILMAWNRDAAILSNTYTFNAAMEYQGQNVGTQIATEELCRKLTGYRTEAVTDSVRIWCGTYGNETSYNNEGVKVSVPSHYYKIIDYFDHSAGSRKTLCYWLPNKSTEKKTLAGLRMISREELVSRLGFDPFTIFNE